VSRSIRLRPWQHAALTRYRASGQADFLAVATPGAGKTTFALAALRTALAERPARLVVVAPTAHLKVQWAHAAGRFGLHLDPGWTPETGSLPADMHGVVTSYQQVAASAPAIAPLARGAYVVLDEIHHAGDDRAWGESLREAFSASARRLSLSGTPFRSDTRAIPFVRYEAMEAVPDYEYGYGDALRDGRVVRPIYFPRTGGRMEWQAPDGEVHEATFDDPLIAQLANQRLRTALSVAGDWMPSVLGEAVGRLEEVRRHQPDAAGLVIATDQDHARAVAGLLERRSPRPCSSLDHPESSTRIARFGEGVDPDRGGPDGVGGRRLRGSAWRVCPVTRPTCSSPGVGRLYAGCPDPDQRAGCKPGRPRLRLRAARSRAAATPSTGRPVADRVDVATRRPPRPSTGSGAAVHVEALSATPGQAPRMEAMARGASRRWEDPPDASIEVDLAPPPRSRAGDDPLRAGPPAGQDALLRQRGRVRDIAGEGRRTRRYGRLNEPSASAASTARPWSSCRRVCAPRTAGSSASRRPEGAASLVRQGRPGPRIPRSAHLV